MSTEKWTGEERRKMNRENCTLDNVMSRLGDIEISIATMTQEIRNNHKGFRDFESATKSLNEKIALTLYGNGQPGLTSLKDLPRRFEAIETWKGSINTRLAFWAGGGACIGALSVFLMKVVFRF